MTQFTKRFCVLGLSLALVVTVGCGGGGAGGANSSDPDVAVELIVKNITPTNSQEVLTKLTDPGLVDPTYRDPADGGVIKTRFSEKLMASTVLDSSNAFNGLSSDVNFLNSAFERVPGTPLIPVEEGGNVLVFVPNGDLPNGQYTLTVTRDVLNFKGGRLNAGRYDFRSSFTVGPDQYSPVIRNTFPAPGQKDVPKTSQIIVTFNETIDASTVNNNTITVQDTAQVPAVTVNGTLNMARDGFEAVFTPDPGTPMPPNGKIEVTVNGGPGGVADIHGNPFQGDPATPGIYQFRFDTVIEPPLPNNSGVTSSVYYCTGNKIGMIDESQFIAGGFIDLANWAIHQPGPPIVQNPVPNSQTNVGKPTEIIVDLRLNNGHTYLYVVDRQTRSIVIVSTRTSRVVHRWKELSDPTGISLSTGSNNLWVCNGASDTVTLLDLAPITVGLEGADQALKDVPLTKRDFPLDTSGTKSLGPVACAHSLGISSLHIANRIDASVTELDTTNGNIVDTLNVNEGPRDVAASNFVMLGTTPVGPFAWISCEGGGDDANGSVALWWQDWLPLGVNSGKGRIQSLLGGFKNPKGLQYDYGLSGGGLRSCWVANSGGNSVARMSINISGAGLATTILPSITADIRVGNNPSDVCLDAARLLTIPPSPPVIITADLGSGMLTFIDSIRLTAPTFSLAVPGVRVVDSWPSQ